MAAAAAGPLPSEPPSPGLEEYQKARLQFVQTVAEQATRPQNIETLQNAGKPRGNRVPPGSCPAPQSRRGRAQPRAGLPTRGPRAPSVGAVDPGPAAHWQLRSVRFPVFRGRATRANLRRRDALVFSASERAVESSQGLWESFIWMRNSLD